MKYSYEYKRMSIELYRQGKWPETPEGVQKREFYEKIRKWVRIEDSCGSEALRHKNQNKEWTAEQRYELVTQVLAGRSVKETDFSAGISDGQLHQRVRRYKMEGYQELTTLRKERPPKEPQMKKKIEPAELTPSEREEMIRLKARIEYLEVENAVIKKEIALREEKWAAQLKAKKQLSSKNSAKKDMP